MPSEDNLAYKTVGIMSGRFQPPHIGHMRSWKWLHNKFDSAFIVTSDVVETLRSPFNFNEKKTMMLQAGIPDDNIIRVKSPYIASEIVDTFDPTSTVIVFAVSQKDMTNNSRFTFQPKKDGTASFLQSYNDNKHDLLPVNKHAYVIVLPTFEFDVAGSPTNSATEIRNQFANANYSTQTGMIEDLYGKYSPDIHDMMRSKIT
jgi:cytidyltransferase-like protein